MEYMGFTNRIISILIFFLCTNCCYTQNTFKSQDNVIFGKWKCVKYDCEGYNKYTVEQAEKIKESILNIEKNRVYYSNIKFIDLCNYSKFKVDKYDTTQYFGYSIELIYSKKELSKVLVYNPVDKEDKPSCFNDCAIFLLKQDTLINICGGYTYYLLKESLARDF